MSASSQNPRFAELLKRTFAFKSSKAFDVEETVLPTFAIGDPSAVENQFLRDERRWMHSISVAALAANYGFARCENPPKSGLLVIVENIYLSTGAGAGLPIQYYISPQISTGVGATTGQDCRPLDTRRYNPTFNGVDVRGGVHPGLNAFGMEVDAQLGTWYPDLSGLNCVLAPGSSLDVEQASQNCALRVGFIYRLRPVDTTEL